MEVKAPGMSAEEKEIEQKMIKVIGQMPKEVQNRFKALKVLSDKRSAIADQFDQEIKVIEAKIAALKQPLYDQRQKIIEGELTEFAEFREKFEATHKQLEAECAKIVTKKEGEKEEEELKAVDVEHLKGQSGVPDFWFRAMKNCQMVFDLVKEKDEEILKHLKHVETKRSDEPKMLTVSFHFGKNEFFAHEVLSLTLHYKGDDNEVSKIEGTQIVWAEGKDPTKKKVKKKQKNKKTNETRTIVKTVEDESFFNVFQNIEVPEGGFEAAEEDEDDMQNKVDAAMNLAEDIDEVLMEDALEYYLGLNDDLFDGDEDDDEDGSEPSQGEDSDGGDKKKSKKKSGKEKKEGAGQQQQQQECKQQ